VSKKIEKSIKLRKQKKNNQKNRTVKKNRLKFWTNRSFGSVRFWFYKTETEKTEPNRTQTEKTRKKPSQTGLNRFRFFLKFFGLVIFFDKNRTKPKMITPSGWSGPRLRFWVLTGSSGRPGQLFFLKKNQNDIVLVKNKTQRVATEFLTGLARSPGHTGFFLPIFFLQPGPVPAPGRPVRLNRVLKLYFKVNSGQFSWPVTWIFSQVLKNYDKWMWKHGDWLIMF
jgi:hypothetical protein